MCMELLFHRMFIVFWSELIIVPVCVCVCVCVCLCSRAQPCLTLMLPMDHSLPGSSVHGILRGRNSGMGCHFLLQKIFPTQRLSPCFLHWQVDSLPLHHWSSPTVGRVVYLGVTLHLSTVMNADITTTTTTTNS